MLELSVSAVMAAAETAQNYKYRYVLGIKEEPSSAMEEGTMVHMLLLEPEKFANSYFTDHQFPEDTVIVKTVAEIQDWLKEIGERPCKGKKEDLLAQARELVGGYDKVVLYDDWLETNTRGKKYVTPLKWQRLHYMKAEVESHKFVSKYLPLGKKEVPLEAEVLGHKIRGRVDWLVDHPDLPYVICIDIKKVRSSEMFRFRRSIDDAMLHVQAALYTEIIKKIYNRDCLFVWHAMELAIPFYNEAYAFNEAGLEAGLVDARVALKRIEEGTATGVWPGRSDGNVQSMDLSNYTLDRIAERQANLEMEEENEFTNI